MWYCSNVYFVSGARPFISGPACAEVWDMHQLQLMCNIFCKYITFYLNQFYYYEGYNVLDINVVVHKKLIFGELLWIC